MWVFYCAWCAKPFDPWKSYGVLNITGKEFTQTERLWCCDDCFNAADDEDDTEFGIERG